MNKGALNKLALRGEFMPQQAWLQIEALTAKLQSSGALPTSIKNGSQLAMVFLAGYEAGMTPMESINSFYIVNGKVTIWGQAILSQLRKAGYSVEWIVADDNEAKVKIISPDGKTSHTESYTTEDAKASGLLGKDARIKYKKDMLRHKAIGRGVRFFCPEVLGGFYLKEEIEDAVYAEAEQMPASKPVDGGKVIDAQVSDKEKLPKKYNNMIHAAWSQLAEGNGWTDEKSDGVRKQTITKYYGVESNNDLTVEQAKDFVGRVKEAIKALPPKPETNVNENAESVDKPEENVNEPDAAEAIAKEFGGKVVVQCPTCKKEYADHENKSGNVAAIDFAGECNECINGKE